MENIFSLKNVHKKRFFLKRFILSAVFLPFLFTFSSFAAENSDNSVIISIEAFTVDYGFVLEPVLTDFDSSDNGASLIEKAFGSENINGGGGAGNYINSIVLDTDFININSFVMDALDENNVDYSSDVSKSGWLSEFDFTKQSGWIFIVNNSIVNMGIADYKPAEGDVIRLAFSVYGSGADLAVNTVDFPLGSEDGIFPNTNRDELYKSMASYYANSDFDLDTYVESIAVDLSVEQEEIDDALGFMNGIIYEVEENDDEESGEESDENSDEFADDDDEEITDDDDEFDTDEITTEPEPDFAETEETAVTTTPEQTTSPDTSYEEFINNIPQADSAPTGVSLPYAGLAILLMLCFFTVIAKRKNI